MADMTEFKAEMRRQAEDLASRVMASDAGQRILGLYEQLGERDRLALRCLGGFGAVVLAYVIAVAPLLGKLDASAHRLTAERSLLAWLQAHDQGAAQIGRAHV